MLVEPTSREADERMLLVGAMWRAVQHYAHAIATRAELLSELRRAHRLGRPLPRRSAWGVLKEPSRFEDRVRLLRFLDPSESVLVIDVGGNNGSWCELTRELFPNNKVLAFEPLADAYVQYHERFRGILDVSVFNTALSDHVNEAQMGVARDSAHSSLHSYHTRQESSLPGAKIVGEQTVPLDTLDNYLHHWSEWDHPGFLKIDVQRHEVEVLRGSAKSLAKCDVVLIECSFADEYQEVVPSFAEVTQILSEHALYPVVFKDFERALSPYGWERDVVFVKRELMDHIWGW